MKELHKKFLQQKSGEENLCLVALMWKLWLCTSWGKEMSP